MGSRTLPDLLDARRDAEVAAFLRDHLNIAGGRASGRFVPGDLLQRRMS
jgi:hypothetical protein